VSENKQSENFMHNQHMRYSDIIVMTRRHAGGMLSMKRG